MFDTQISSAPEQALENVFKSIALEEEALSKILNLEKEIVGKLKNDPRNMEEFIAFNESVNNVLKNVVKLQMLMQIKLEQADGLFHRIGDSFNESEELFRKIEDPCEHEDPCRDEEPEE
jgi:hypothetical protein